MALAGEGGQRMVVTLQSDRLRIADVIDDLDAGAHLVEPESLALQNLAVTLGVKIREPVAEFERLAVDDDLAEGGFPIFQLFFRQGVSVDTQEITDAGFVETDEPGHAVMGGDMHDVFLYLAEDMAKHVVEVYADVGGDAAAFAFRAFPAGEIPVAPRCDVRQIYIIYCIVGGAVHLLLQGFDGRVQAELQDVVHPLARLVFHGLQHIHIPWVQHQRFLADDIRAQTQGVARVRVVQVVRGADGDDVQLVVRVLELGDMPVEELHLREESRLGEIAVDDADTVGLVVCGNHLVSSLFDSLQMSRRHITAHSENSEILHNFYAKNLGAKLHIFG